MAPPANAARNWKRWHKSVAFWQVRETRGIDTPPAKVCETAIPKTSDTSRHGQRGGVIAALVSTGLDHDDVVVGGAVDALTA